MHRLILNLAWATMSLRPEMNYGRSRNTYIAYQVTGKGRLYPFWDSLRGDPRSEKLIEESKKPIAIQ